MNFLRTLFFYIIFYSWTIIFFLIFSPVKFFSRKFVLKLSTIWTGSVIKLAKNILKIDYEISGLKNIPKKKFFLLVSNHQSAWETFFYSFFFDKSIFILKKELKKVPLMSWYFQKLGFIFIDRGRGFKSIKQIINSIEHVKKMGVKVIIIFPEGTRMAVDERGELNTGVFAIHKFLKIPVLVVKHDAGCYWRNKKFIKKPGTIKMKIYPLIEKEEKKEFFMKKIKKLIH